jgi:hypothetical protein
MSTGAAAVASPGCVGAAARDPKHPCTNPTLSVFPAPAAADSERGTPCPRIKQDPQVCTIGAPASKAKGHFAILGDSHVFHWREPLHVIGKVKRWQGFVVYAHSCSFSDAVKKGPDDRCTEWYQSVLAWFRDHPEVSTVFVTHVTTSPVVVKPGFSGHGSGGCRNPSNTSS